MFQTESPAAPVPANGDPTLAEKTQQLTEAAREKTWAIMDTFGNAIEQIVLFVPYLLAALVALVVGYVISRFVGKLVAKIAEGLGLQVAADRSGLSESMRQVGIQRTVPQILGLVTFWLLLCVFLLAACNILGLPAVTQAVQTVVDFIPRLLVAIVVIVVGMLAATFLRGVIATSADRVGLNYASQLASACYYLLAMMTFIAAFEQLNIKFELLNTALLIAFGAIALGFGLSFGLGGRDVMGGILAGYYLRQRFHAGDVVYVAGYEGRVREIGPVATVIETDEAGLPHRHSIPNTRMLNEAVR